MAFHRTALAISLLALLAGCGKKTPCSRVMDAETAARYAAVPAVGACPNVPAWAAVTNAAAFPELVQARDGSAPARLLPRGGVELPCAFSRQRADRACWDISLSLNLTNAYGVAFDFWCGDVTQFTGFSIYFRSGEGWHHVEFSPLAEGQWHRVTIPRARVRNRDGQPGGWDAVSTVRLAGWRGGTNDTELALANFGLAVPPAVPTAAELAAERSITEAWLKRQSGQKGEWRAFWCHNYRGLGGGRTWDDTVRILRENNFNVVLANLAWAGVAFYPSDVLPVFGGVARMGDQLAACRDACRKYGVACHVWNVCWNLGHHATPAHVAEMAAQGRTQVRFDGTRKDGWLCPSHPDNRALEVQIFLEQARLGVDGIHLDYIRYPDESCCFCAGCRRRFEEQYGLSLTNWPRQVRADAAVKALWREFRITNITTLVATAAREIRRVAPNVQVSAAVFQNPETNPRAIGQDWADWCRRGLLDFVCPMDYNYDSAVAFKGVVFGQKRHLAGAKTKLRPGIGLSCWADRTQDVRKTAEEILAVRAAGLDGFSIFNLDARAVSVLPALRRGPLK